VFLGELRHLKGIHVLIDAIAQLHRDGRNVTATLVGDGPDRDGLLAHVERCGLNAAVRFQPAMAARQAMTLGKVMVAPSRFESLPYVVLEAAAASKPLITTHVGGIPEIYGPLSNALVPPADAAALAGAIARALDRPQDMMELTRKLRDRVQASFSVESMVDGVLTAYQTALETLGRSGRR
jgi:glycosyltransferase involved in cell wall biosynthesis